MSLRRGAISTILCSVLGCSPALSCAGEGNGATRAPQRTEGDVSTPAAPGAGRTVRVGNQAKGIEDQPDYDLQAQAMREQVQPRLPQPLPEPAMACTKMLDAVMAYYRQVEGESSNALTILQRTREDDQRACVQQTSPAASTCVAILIAEQAGEYPWLLDQCSRAFPG